MSSGKDSIKALLDRHAVISGMITRRQLELVLTHLQAVLDVNIEGAIVELGCCMGTTSLFIRRLLNQHATPRCFHVYDSFLGLPAKRAEDESLDGSVVRPGSCKSDQTVLLANFREAGLVAPEIHKGWFGDIPADCYPERIAFAFLDGDFYDSIWDSLDIVYPRLSRGAVVVLHDYRSPMLPGVARASADFLRDKAEKDSVIEEELIGVFRKS